MALQRTHEPGTLHPQRLPILPEAINAALRRSPGQGLLSIVLNPSDLEVMVDGAWRQANLNERGEPLPSNYGIVMVGNTLERATNGRFRAAPHRVKNSGTERFSTVLKLRASPATRLDLKWAAWGRDRCLLEPVLPVLEVREILYSFALTATQSVNKVMVQSESAIQPKPLQAPYAYTHTYVHTHTHTIGDMATTTTTQTGKTSPVSSQ